MLKFHDLSLTLFKCYKTLVLIDKNIDKLLETVNILAFLLSFPICNDLTFPNFNKTFFFLFECY